MALEKGSRDPGDIVVLGIRIPEKKNLRFMLLASGALVCGVGLSIVQESVFWVPGFKYGGWMTFLTYISWILCGTIERMVIGASARKGSLKGYALVSILTLSGVYLTNWSLNYINYATRIIAKSCKVLPVMVIRVVLQGKSHSFLEYCSAIVLVFGISLITMGDMKEYPAFNFIGMLVIGIALVCDAMTSNLEEQWFFNTDDPCPHSEVVYFLSIFSALYAFTILVVTGEALPATQHSWEHKEVVPLVLTFSILGYVGVEFVLLLVQHFGATNAEIVKSSRRVLQIALSFLIFPKPFTWRHGVGGVAVLMGLFWYQQIRHRTSLASERKESGIPPEIANLMEDEKRRNETQPYVETREKM